jgi:hypothetical protein
VVRCDRTGESYGRRRARLGLGLAAARGRQKNTGDPRATGRGGWAGQRPKKDQGRRASFLFDIEH